MIFILAGNKFLLLFSLFRPKGRANINQTGSTRNRSNQSGGYRKKIHAPITELENWVSIKEKFAASTIIEKLS